ncbi:MAG: glycosyltransferase family 39 protein [Anaerolineae bacterium]|nr:glycosyltransferase family 39 protein [Anaerolineae bacterium]
MLCVETSLQDGLWIDEVWSLWAVRPARFVEMLARIRHDYHPPLYFALLDGWVALVGDSVLAIRLLSTLFALLAAAVTYAAGKRLFDGETGLAAAALLGCSGFFRYYAVETRMYSLLLLFCVLCMYQYMCWLRRPSLLQSILYGSLLALTIYTHYFGGWLVLAHCVHLLLFHRDRLAAWFGPTSLALMLFLPWFPTLANQIYRRSASSDMTTLSASLSAIGQIFSMATSGLGAALLLPYLFFPDRQRLRRHIPSLALMLVWLIAPIIFAVCFKDYFFHSRYVIGILPAGALMIAFGVRSASWRYLSAAALIVMLVFSLNAYRCFWPSRSAAYEEIFHELNNERAETDFLILDLHPDNLVGYYDRHVRLGLRDQAAIDLTDRPYHADEIDAIIDGLPQNAPIWLVLPSNVARTWYIFSGFDKTHYTDYGSGIQNMLFYRFVSGSDPGLAYRFGDHIGHIGTWSPRYLTAGPGTPVCLEMELRALQPIDGSYSVGVHIVDESNRSLAQWDDGLGILETSEERLLSLCIEGSEVIPVGEYDIQVSIYNWQTMARLPVFEVSTGHEVYWGDILVFGHVHVQDLPQSDGSW